MAPSLRGQAAETDSRASDARCAAGLLERHGAGGRGGAPTPAAPRYTDAAAVRRHDVGAAQLHELPEVQHADHIRQVAHHADVVRNEQIRAALLVLESIQQVQDRGLDRGVQRRGGLVAQDQRWRAGERARDRHALALSAAQLGRQEPTDTAAPGPLPPAVPLARCWPPAGLRSVSRLMDRSSSVRTVWRGLSVESGS